MKQQKFYLICAMAWLAVTMCFCTAFNVCNAEQMRGRIILIGQRPTNPVGNGPRSQTENPFSAELLDAGVILMAGADWGDVDVTLSSLEGDYYQTIFDMADGAILLPINGNNGDSYTITIVTPGDIVFEGEFYL